MGLAVVDLNSSSSGLKPWPGRDGRDSACGVGRDGPDGIRSRSARGPDGGARKPSGLNDSWWLRGGGGFPDGALLGSTSCRTASAPSSVWSYRTSQRGAGPPRRRESSSVLIHCRTFCSGMKSTKSVFRLRSLGQVVPWRAERTRDAAETLAKLAKQCVLMLSR